MDCKMPTAIAYDEASSVATIPTARTMTRIVPVAVVVVAVGRGRPFSTVPVLPPSPLFPSSFGKSLVYSLLAVTFCFPSDP